MPPVFDRLLVSSPNGGGLLLVTNDQVARLDDIDTTGISLNAQTLVRGIQPKGWVIVEGNQFISAADELVDDIHDVLVVGEHIYIVGTMGNEVVQANRQGTEIRRWSFPGEADALHINCLAFWNDRVLFCAFGDFRKHRDYKGQTQGAGFVADLHSGERLISGLSQPHSLTVHGDCLLVANSETKELLEYDANFQLVRRQTLAGYTRGVCVGEHFIYVGLSCSRNLLETSVTNAQLIALRIKDWSVAGQIDLPVGEVYGIQQAADQKDLVACLSGISQFSSQTYRQMIGVNAATAAEVVAQKQGLELQMDTLRAEYDQVVRSNEAYLSAAQTAQVDHAEQKAWIEHMTATLQQQIDELNKQSQAYILEQQVRFELMGTAQQQRMDDLARKNDELTNELSDRERQMAEFNKLVALRVDDLVRKNDELTKELSERENQLAELNSLIALRVDDLARKNDGLTNELSEREKQLAEFNKSIALQSEQLEKMLERTSSEP